MIPSSFPKMPVVLEPCRSETWDLIDREELGDRTPKLPELPKPKALNSLSPKH